MHRCHAPRGTQLQLSLMGTGHCLDHGQAQASAVGLGGKNGSPRRCSTCGAIPLPLSLMHRRRVCSRVYRCTFNRAPGPLAWVAFSIRLSSAPPGCHGCTAIRPGGCRIANAGWPPAHGSPLPLAATASSRRGNAIGQRQFATGKHQHVAHLVLQLMQALPEAPGKALMGGRR